MKQQLVKISQLKNNTGQIKGLPKNPRILKDDKFEKLKKSIHEDPEMLELREIIAYDNNGKLVVICGNMRLRAMQDLGIKEAPTKILPPETPIEKLKAYVIKDNVSFGEHNWDTLANEWNVEELCDWGLDIPNFEIETETEDYSDKNKEIDTDEFSDKMTLKFEVSQDEYEYILSELQKINASKETALLTLLKYEP